ncbi:MAG: DUF1499 domain-containing protein [Parvularculaceae bacterium]
MKFLVIAPAAFAAIALGLFALLAQRSKAAAPPGLVDGALKPCPSSPNCVSSEAAGSVAPLPLSAWSRLPSAIADLGGEVVMKEDDYLAATFASPLFGFVDDMEFRRADDRVHGRSASRVGHSDLGANARRVEALRRALGA